MPALRYWFGVSEDDVDFGLPTDQVARYVKALEGLPPVGSVYAIMVTGKK